jgi:hypothetical protein
MVCVVARTRDRRLRQRASQLEEQRSRMVVASSSRSSSDASTAWLWTIRLTVLAGFAATLVFAGPRALAVTRGRVAELQRTSPRGPVVELDRVGFVAAPDWLRDDLSARVAAELSAILDHSIALLDDVAAAALLERLRAVPWVRTASLQRVYPDKLRACLRLREPVARVLVDDRTQAVDAEGITLPWTATASLCLPELLVPAPVLGELGVLHPDAAIQSGAAIAAEWAAEIAARVPSPPRLLAIDLRNLGYRQLGPGHLCEVRVGVARASGGVAWLDYDHPVGSPSPRVAGVDKADVLARLLAAFPGLDGVARADLRFKQRWRDWVRVDEAGADERGR